MSVHYKFKSARSYDTIAFDGLHISVRDLKKAILHQKQIGKSTDFDLQITNAHTNEVYTEDSALIPKNSSLIVSRIPLTAQQKKAWEKSDAAQQHLINLNKGDSPDHLLNNKFAKSADLTSIDASEDDKIQAAIHQSTFDYDPSNYVRIKNSSQVGEVPPNYRCYKCLQPGHWIKDCKLNNNQDASAEIRKSTGIPRSFMVPVNGPEVPGAMMTPSGHFAVPTIDHEARREMPKKAAEPLLIDKPPIPEDLECGVCKDLLTDAVMIPCCGNSFCDECIRNVLLESEDHQCPDCKEKDVSPDTLIPSRFLRNCVNNFKNQTGYSRSTPAPPPAVAPQPIVQPPQAPPPAQIPVVPPPVAQSTNHHPPPAVQPSPAVVVQQPPPTLTKRHPSEPETIEVEDEDVGRPGSPEGKAIPSLTSALPNIPNSVFIRHNPNLATPFLAQTPGVPGQPTSQPHLPFSSFRGRGRGDGYSEQWGSGRGRGYSGAPPGGVRPLGHHQPPVHPPPHLHFSQTGGYVFQPVYGGGNRSDYSDGRGYYRGTRARLPPPGTFTATADPFEMFEKMLKEKDNRRRERVRSRSRSYSRSWSRSPTNWSPVRSRSPKGRSRSPKGRSRSPTLRSRSPKARSRSPKSLSSRSPKRSPGRKRTPPMKRSSPKVKVQPPRSRSPHKRSASRSRSRTPPYSKRRSRSRSKSFSCSSRYYGERKYKSEVRQHKPTIRSSVYKTHDYGTPHEHPRYPDRYEREYVSSRSYLKAYETLDPKIGNEWERIRDREINLRRQEGHEPYPEERRERELSANRIIQDLHERDKERDRIHEKELPSLLHMDIKPPDFKERRSSDKEKDKKCKKDRKKKKEDSDKKKKKKRLKEKEERKTDNATYDEIMDTNPPVELPPEPEPPKVVEVVKEEKPPKPKILIEEKVKQPEKEVEPEDLYKDLDANVDMKPFENLKIDKVESPVKKSLPESAPIKDVMLAPVPELSKWEKDDEVIFSHNEMKQDLETIKELVAEEPKPSVTSEVLKRAENAIFKKGVNPIKEMAVNPPKPEKREKEKPPKEEKRRESDKKERSERIMNKEPIIVEQYIKEMKPVKSIALPMKSEVREGSRRRKTDRIVLAEKEKTRISAKDRLGAKIEEKMPERELKREVKYGKVTRSDEDVVARVLHRDVHSHHNNHRERKVVTLDSKDDSKKDRNRTTSETVTFEVSDDDRSQMKESLRSSETVSMSKKRSTSIEMISPVVKKSRPSPPPVESSEDISSDESVELPKKHKKKRKSKKKKKNKKKSKSKHDSSSDSVSSSSSSESDSEDNKKKKKHKHKSRKKSKKSKKSKK